MKQNLFVLIMTLTPLFGCDKLCNFNVEETVVVKNLTNRPLQLKVCVGVHGERELAIPADRNANSLTVGSHTEGEVVGGPSGKCNVSDKKQDQDIELSPASFGSVKLCVDRTTKTNVIVENFYACPYGTDEQIDTAPCRTFGSP